MLRLAAALVLLLGMEERREPAVGTGPEPSPTPISWEFDFKYLHPRRIDVQPPGAAQREIYWYMVYTVTNTANTTQHFYPTFQLVTDELRLIDTDMGINPLVFEAIKQRHKVTHPYLVHPTKAIGDLRTGADYARESVAIWRASDVSATEFTIYVAGLSGEARIVRNPAYNLDEPETTTIVTDDGREHEVTVNPKYFTLRKTLQLHYKLAASERARQEIEPRLEEARWIMR
jgi:hypothetical protein